MRADEDDEVLVGGFLRLLMAPWAIWLMRWVGGEEISEEKGVFRVLGWDRMEIVRIYVFL